ncbi:hypothetical protein ABQ359_22295 [Serratia fonticola]|uniref:hypothetical protein n=1 Tax=Serratia fonticola TaxID=47917 RepID=UPI003AAF9DE4
MITYNVVRNGNEVVEMFSKARFGVDAEAHAHDRADELRDQQPHAEFHISVSVPKIRITLSTGEVLEQNITDPEIDIFDNEISGLFYSDARGYTSFRFIESNQVSNVEFIA